jgi:4-hydroxy-2-oxoheptanedioate aldolase
MGVKHFCIGWDVRILHDWWVKNGEGMRRALAKDAGAPAAPVRAKETASTY